MKLPSRLLIVIGALVLIGRAAVLPESHVIKIDHETVARAFAKGEGLLATNNFKIQAGRREKAGEVEVHEKDTDIFYILEGSATFVTGGSVIEPRTTSPGETRGSEIRGGETRELVKGDIIVIPIRVPHWFKAVRGPFLYYVVKVSK
jgi:glc operon protein GlcG